MHWKGFQRPKRIEVDSETLTEIYGRFTAEPFERGFASTVGNSMRRCLLSSIEGAAVTAVQIESVLHEFSSIPGVVEDVTDIILNLKQVAIRLEGHDEKILSLDVSGPGQVRAGDLQGDSSVVISDPDVHIATLNEEGTLKMQVQVRNGRGYVGADRNLTDTMGIGWIPMDSVHSPVRRVDYKVEAARLGRTTDYERLILEVFTNGTVSPDDALSLAATLLKSHLTIFIDSEEMISQEPVETETEDDSGLQAVLDKRIDEMDLSVRSANCLKNANIHTLRDLVTRTEKEMLETKNFGRKSLQEVQEILDKLDLHLGMDVADPPVETADISA